MGRHSSGWPPAVDPPLVGNVLRRRPSGVWALGLALRPRTPVSGARVALGWVAVAALLWKAEVETHAASPAV
jgi:hypothetical protein